ncbi:hypothetical protein HK097_003357 [Rhizophlyctis rosea]|uniref:Uncharacterized protein n=1 Tax=Rhizophlyctis rosea TaxID=64517 RepID=A0AAD5SHZ2_9FUNG|nr:hypothetical protein HK097_003357 [Rhizophlyctis rosea]
MLFTKIDLIPSAGPLLLEAMRNENGPNSSFKRYWTSGRLDGKDEGNLHPNPLLAYTEYNKDFALHYASNPLDGFHLAGAYAVLEGQEKENDAISVLDAAHQEFREWGRCWVEVCKAKEMEVCLRFWRADALDCCSVLEILGSCRQSPTQFHSPIHGFGMAPIILTADYSVTPRRLPTKFDVIDTSNLADHIGFLNLLPSTIPLLRRSSGATLYTDVLVARKHHTDDLTQFLMNSLHMDPVVFASLTGLAPEALILPFTCRLNVGFEYFLAKVLGNEDRKQHAMHIGWRVFETMDGAVEGALSDGGVMMDPTDFGEIMWNVYKGMFTGEDIMQLIDPSNFKPSMLGPHYTRTSFARVLSFLSNRTGVSAQIDKCSYLTEVVKHVVEKASKHFVTFMSHHEDLKMCLHFEGISSSDALRPTEEDIDMGRSNVRSILKDASLNDLPLVIRLAFLVPRQTVDKLLVLQEGVSESRSMNRMELLNTPRMVAHVCVGYKDHIFGGLNYSFVRKIDQVCRRSGGHDGIGNDGRGWKVDCDTFSLEEDVAGMFGSGELAIMFDVPTWLLMAEPEKTKISIALVQDERSPLYVRLLGMGLEVVRADLKDVDRVGIVARSPYRGESELAKLMPMNRMAGIARPDSAKTENGNRVAVPFAPECIVSSSQMKMELSTDLSLLKHFTTTITAESEEISKLLATNAAVIVH